MEQLCDLMVQRRCARGALHPFGRRWLGAGYSLGPYRLGSTALDLKGSSMYLEKRTGFSSPSSKDMGKGRDASEDE